MCNVGRYYKNSGRDVIGQLICDVIGRLSVEPRCNWLERLNSDWCVSIRLQVLGQYVYRRNTLGSTVRVNQCVVCLLMSSMSRLYGAGSL